MNCIGWVWNIAFPFLLCSGFKSFGGLTSHVCVEMVLPVKLLSTHSTFQETVFLVFLSLAICADGFQGRLHTNRSSCSLCFLSICLSKVDFVLQKKIAPAFNVFFFSLYLNWFYYFPFHAFITVPNCFMIFCFHIYVLDFELNLFRFLLFILLSAFASFFFQYSQTYICNQAELSIVIFVFNRFVTDHIPRKHSFQELFYFKLTKIRQGDHQHILFSTLKQPLPGRIFKRKECSRAFHFAITTEQSNIM